MKHLYVITLAALGLTSCVSEKKPTQNNTITWHGDIKPMFERSCTNCHAENKIAFRLDTIDEAVRHQTAVVSAVNARRMPIWLAETGHREYENDPTLSDGDIAKIKTWYSIGSPEGSIRQPQLIPDTPVVLPLTDFIADIEVTQLPQHLTYTPPTDTPDDYRCFMSEWPSDDPVRYITGFHVIPGNERIVHHLVAFKVNRAVVPMLKKLEAEEDRPGYRCFGGSFPDRLGDESVRVRMEKEFPGQMARLKDSDMWLLHWAPGMGETMLPGGVGIPVSGDDVIILQMHYYSAAAPGESDSGTTVLFKTEKQVEKPAFVFALSYDPWFGGKYNKSMVIPAGESATFTTKESLANIVDHGKRQFNISGVVKNVEILSANLHMHSYGASTETALLLPAGNRQMLLNIKNWDLHWQRDYMFKVKIVIPANEMTTTFQDLTCRYVNPTRKDVYGGLGSDDEMCLSMSIYALDLVKP